MAEKSVRLLDKHFTKLDGEFERLKDMGYNIGDAETAHAAAAGVSMPMKLSTDGMPAQADFTSSNRKRKLPGAINTTSALSSGSINGNSQTPAFSGTSPMNMYYQPPPIGNPYVAASGSLTTASVPGGSSNGVSLYSNAAISSPINSPYAASVGQYNAAALSQSQQQQFAQAFQNQYNASVGQLHVQQPSSGGGNVNLGNTQASTGGAGASRPHRPSRLSSSFGPTGAGPNTQILPSSTVAHLLPFQGSATNGGPGSAGLQVASPNLSSNKRSRALAASNSNGNLVTSAIAGGSANGTGNRKKKKRILISDEESGVEEGDSEDAEEAEDDNIMQIDEEGDPIFKSSRRATPGGIAVLAGGAPSSQRASSRAGTPLSAVPTPNSASNIVVSNTNGSVASSIRSGGQSRMNRQQQHVSASSSNNKRRGDHAEREDGDEDADAEGEEDWGNEADETNADDPTLYCLCHRVSYGNVSRARQLAACEEGKQTEDTGA